jgi:hypothetical protein
MVPTHFTTWWQVFVERLQEAAIGQDVAAQLKRHVAGLQGDARRECVLGLVDVFLHRRQAWEFAAIGLQFCEDDMLGPVADHFATLLDQQESDADDIAALFCARVLAKSGNSRNRRLIADYLLRRPFRLGWTGVPGALWPHDKKLFAQAWVRFYLEVPSSNWTVSLSRRWLNWEPEALLVVRNDLAKVDSKKWAELRAAVLSQLSAVDAPDDLRQRFSSVLEDAG